MDDITECFSRGCDAFENGYLVKAIFWFEQVIAIKDHSPTYSNLSSCYFQLGRLTEAENAARAAIKCNPKDSDAYMRLAIIYRDYGNIPSAMSHYDASIALKKDPQAMSNRLLCSQYWTSDSMEYFARLPKIAPKYDHLDRPEHDFRIGYVGSSFRTHACMYFFEHVLPHHNCKVHIYSDTPEDGLSNRLKLFCNWFDCRGLPNNALASKIKCDNIDVLIDLQGHAGLNRLGMFALKPAPVQVTYLGYPNTTGIDAIDYRIVDNVTDPANSNEWYSEKLHRLEAPFVSYAGPNHEIPKRPDRKPVFFSFANSPKLNKAVLDVFAEISKDHKLIIKNPSTRDARYCEMLQESLPRAEIRPYNLDQAEHFEQYQDVDIMLDTWPYNGTTTLCEALWMGCPVVTMCGDVHRSRVGRSLLSVLKLDSMVATTKGEYISKALKLAGDADFLHTFQQGIREYMGNSVLCDGKLMANKLEAAYKSFYERWKNEG